jgi:serralysin
LILAIAFAECAKMADATGTAGNDTILGGLSDDNLRGGAGSDDLRGGDGNDRMDLVDRRPELQDELVSLANEAVSEHAAGADTLLGGRGDDRYGVNEASDQVIEFAGEGQDTVFVVPSISFQGFTLPDNVEHLIFKVSLSPDGPEGSSGFGPENTPRSPVQGTGNALNNLIVGGVASDTLIGEAGNDTLVGSSEFAIDDRFFPPNNPDTLIGGVGDDQYEVDAQQDVVLEGPGEGADTIRVTRGALTPLSSNVINFMDSYSLNKPSLANVENLVLGNFYTSGGTIEGGLFTLEGNSLDNLIVGSNFTEVLRGLDGNDRLIGGPGDDTMYGAAGDDYYDVDSDKDKISEEGDTAIDATKPGQIGGRDTIATTLDKYSLELEGRRNVENLTATRAWNGTSFGAETRRDFTGNSLDNEIVGGDLGDTLSGGDGNDFLIGGRGGDQLIGGAGDDDYDVDSASDIVVEGGGAGSGSDTVSTSLRVYSLQGTPDNPGLANVEHLIFKGEGEPPTINLDRTVGFTGTGNGQNNVIVGADGHDFLLGLSGDDVLVGLFGKDHIVGGAGNDVMDGGPDFDTAVFNFNFSDAIVSYAGGRLVIQGPEGRDEFIGFENLQFQDVSISLFTRQVDDNPLVDDAFYLAANPDVAAAGVDPEAHFATFGWKEGRQPNAFFDTIGYLTANPDVAAAGVNPLEHYDTFGWKEGRDPSAQFDTEGYLAANPDVAAAGINPLAHFLQYGLFEGRNAINDGIIL